MRDGLFGWIKGIVGRDAIQAVYKLFRFIPDAAYLKLMYRLRMGQKLDLENPRRFNEKLQWIKLYDRNPEYTTMVDKYLVKDYVAKKIGEKYVVPLLGVWDRAEDIDFSSLPERFVLKCNHDSYGIVICQDKSVLDEQAAKKKLKKGLKNNFFFSYREWPYKNVQRKIIAEQYIEDEDAKIKGDLPDYKVLCFNGKPEYIMVHQGRFKGAHTQDWFDTEWNNLGIDQPNMNHSPSPIQYPEFLGEMLDLSRKLSEGIPCVRVDWYHANGQLYFGEITFFDGSGFTRFIQDEYDFRIGEKLILPEKRRG